MSWRANAITLWSRSEAAIHGGQPLDEVRGEPALRNLRADPRYQQLMAGVIPK